MPSSLLPKAGAWERCGNDTHPPQQPAPPPGQPPPARPRSDVGDQGQGSTLRVVPVSFARTIPRVGSGAGGKQLLRQPGSGSGSARGEEADDGETQRRSNTALPPRQLKSGHLLHPAPGAATFLAVREGAMGHHVDPLPGKSCEPAAAPTELAVPPEPTASPFLLLSFFLSVLSPL